MSRNIIVKNDYSVLYEDIESNQYILSNKGEDVYIVSKDKELGYPLSLVLKYEFEIIDKKRYKEIDEEYCAKI
jgi:hypothetical protein